MRYAKLKVDGKVISVGLYENMVQQGTYIKRRRPVATVILVGVEGSESNIFTQRV